MRQIKGFICGVIFAAGLMAIPAVADTVEKSITVLTDYVTVQVDGQTKDVRNFVSDGTTYIALRDVANVFGYQVGWDDATRVASITTGKTAAADETAMEVNGEKISAADFKIMYDKFAKYYQSAGATAEEITTAAKQELATQAVVNQKAKELNAADISKIEEDVKAELTTLDMSYGESVVNQLITAQGFASREDYIANSVNYSINQAVFTYLENNEDSYKSVKDNAKEYYEENKEAYKEHSVQVKHILIPTVDLTTKTPLSDEEQKAAKETADKIAKEATADNFDELIKTYNKDGGQTEDGYYVTADSNFVTEFKTAALELKKAGDISKLVKSQYGYHIILATAVNEYTPYEQFLQTYLGEKYNELDRQYAEKWLKEANIVYNDDVIKAITSK